MEKLELAHLSSFYLPSTETGIIIRHTRVNGGFVHFARVVCAGIISRPLQSMCESLNKSNKTQKHYFDWTRVSEAKFGMWRLWFMLKAKKTPTCQHYRAFWYLAGIMFTMSSNIVFHVSSKRGWWEYGAGVWVITEPRNYHGKQSYFFLSKLCTTVRLLCASLCLINTFMRFYRCTQLVSSGHAWLGNWLFWFFWFFWVQSHGLGVNVW